MPWFIPLLNAIVAMPKIGDMVKGAIQQIVLWYVQVQDSGTLAAIADAAAFAARAQTKEERYAAAEKWQAALSRPRVTP